MFDPRAKACIRCEHFFQKIEQMFGVYCFVIQTFLNLFRLFRIFSCLDVIDFCCVQNTYVHRIFIKLPYSYQITLYFFAVKHISFHSGIQQLHCFFISINALSILKQKIISKITTFQAYIQAEKKPLTYFRLEQQQKATQFYQNK